MSYVMAWNNLVILSISVCLYLLKGKLELALLKKTRPVIRMYFVMLHQKDSMSNGVWFLVCLPPRVKSSPSWESLEDCLGLSAYLCINRPIQFASIQSFLSLPVPLVSSGQLWSSSLLICCFTTNKKGVGVLHWYLLTRKRFMSHNKYC